MSTQKPQLKTYVNEDIYNKFKILAKKQHRSTSNYLELLAIKEINDYEAAHGVIELPEDENK